MQQRAIPLTADEIKRMAAVGKESQTVEFKQQGENQTDIGELLISFANAEGGIILVGVDDKGRIVGCTDQSGLKKKLIAAARMCRPPLELLMDYYFVDVDGKEVLAVHVPARHDSVYSYSNRFRIRRGDRNEYIDGIELTQMARARGGNDFEQTVLPELSLDDIDPLAIEALKQGRAKLGGLNGIGGTDTASLGDDIDMLIRLGAVVSERGKIVPTVAGVLALGRDTQAAVPQAVVLLARYEGKSATRILDRQFAIGNVPQQVDSVMAFVARNTTTAAKVVGLYREDIPQYPVEAIREAVANALSHRSYYDPAYRVQVNIFTDRIEVVSPGGVLPGVELRDFRGYARRNPNLAFILSWMRVVESWGTGLARMRDEMAKVGLPDPAFTTNDFSVTVTLYGRNAQVPGQIVDPQAVTRPPLPPHYDALKLKARQADLIYSLLQSGGGTISPRIYRDRYSISEQQANEDLVMLMNMGVLGRTGKARATRYFLLEQETGSEPTREPTNELDIE